MKSSTQEIARNLLRIPNPRNVGGNGDVFHNLQTAKCDAIGMT